MKSALLCGITLLVAAPVFAQAGATATADQNETKTVTLTGCVGTAGEAKAITLSNALIIPGTAQPGQLDQTPSLIPPPVSGAGTEPIDATLPPPTAAPASPSPLSPVGTSGVKTPSSSAAAGTTGIVTGTAPAGSSASSVTGYRLSGADMQPWVGKRVQVIGTFAPATAPTAAAPTSATTAASAPPAMEFRVQTVQPATGPCPR